MIFVYRIGHLGDSIVAIPAVSALARAFPGDDLVLVTNAPRRPEMVTAWDVLRHTGLFKDVIFYAPTPWSVLGLAMTLRKAAKRGARLYYLAPARSRLQRRRDAWFFRRVCGLSQVLGLGRSARGPVRDEHGALLRLESESDRLLSGVCRELGIEHQRPAVPLLHVPDAVRHEVDRWFEPGRNTRLIGMGIGTKMPSKKWFLDRYVELAGRILDRFPTSALVLLGGAEDRAEGEQLASRLGRARVTNLAGTAGIIASAAVLARCALFVGNDTGTMHLAAAMGTRCVAVFSARDNPGLWEPYGQGHRVIRRDVPCAGCHLVECHEFENRCLAQISVDDVWQQVVAALEEDR